MPFDPDNYSTWDSFAKALQQHAPGFAGTEDAQKMSYLKAAQDSYYRSANKRRMVDDYKLQQTGAAGPSLEGQTGVQPARMGPASPGTSESAVEGAITRGEGAGPVEPTNWWTRNVGRPMLRDTEAGIAAFWKGPEEGMDVYKNPGQHPMYRGAARMIPLLGSESPGQFAIDAVMLGLYSTGIGEEYWAIKQLRNVVKDTGEVSKVLRPAARLGIRMTIPAVAAGGATAATGGSLGESVEAAAGGASQELFGEGLSALFGTARRGLRNYDMKQLQEWTNKYLGSDVKFGNFTHVDQWYRKNMQGSGRVAGTVVSGAEDFTERQLARVEKEIGQHVDLDEPMEFLIPEEVRNRVEPPGMHIAKPAQPAIAPQPAGKRLNPMWKPGGSMGRKYNPTLPIPGRAAVPAIPEGTYRMSINEARGLLDQVRNIGWKFDGKPVETRVGAVMRAFATEAEGYLATEFERQTGTNLGGRWQSAMWKRDLAQAMTKLMSTEGAIEGGRINGPVIQKAANTMRSDFVQILGGKRAGDLFSHILHGAAPGAATDITGHITPYTRIHPGAGLFTGHGGPMGLLGASIGLHGQLPFRTGTPPLDMGRGAMWAVYTLLPWGLARGIWTSLGGDEDDAVYEPDSHVLPGRGSREMARKGR